MVNKGGFSFVAMLVINPIVILFYQNCSMSPISQAKELNSAQNSPTVVERSIASEEKDQRVSTLSYVCSGQKSQCAQNE
jgi:hypothetical protein